MSVHLITYDLRKPGQDYSKLSVAIKALGQTWQCLGSVWLLKTNLTAIQVRDTLQPHIDANDDLLVVAVSRNCWGSYGLNKDGTDWLSKSLAG